MWIRGDVQLFAEMMCIKLAEDSHTGKVHTTAPDQRFRFVKGAEPSRNKRSMDDITERISAHDHKRPKRRKIAHPPP